MRIYLRLMLLVPLLRSWLLSEEVDLYGAPDYEASLEAYTDMRFRATTLTNLLGLEEDRWETVLLPRGGKYFGIFPSYIRLQAIKLPLGSRSLWLTDWPHSQVFTGQPRKFWHLKQRLDRPVNQHDGYEVAAAILGLTLLEENRKVPW